MGRGAPLFVRNGAVNCAPVWGFSPCGGARGPFERLWPVFAAAPNLEKPTLPGMDGLALSGDQGEVTRFNVSEGEEDAGPQGEKTREEERARKQDLVTEDVLASFRTYPCLNQHVYNLFDANISLYSSSKKFPARLWR